MAKHASRNGLNAICPYYTMFPLTFPLGRLKADRDTQEHLGWQLDRAEAVKQACALAGANHRVFLYANAGTPYYLPFDCAEVSK